MTTLFLNTRLPVLLSLSWWQPDCYKLWRYHLVSFGTLAVRFIYHVIGFFWVARVWTKLTHNVILHLSGVYKHLRKFENWKADLSNPVFHFIVHFGTLRLASRPPRLLDTQVMSWACHWLLTQGYLSLVLVMPLLNSGMSERACADRHLLATSLTLMPSV